MFLTDLELIAEPQPDIWRVGAPLIWCDPVFGRLEAPVDFKTDLASIPRLFRNLPWLDPDGVSRRPAVLHDWLYDTCGGRRWGKEFADDFLYAALCDEGAGRPTGWAYWAAVHYFGHWSWNEAGVNLLGNVKTGPAVGASHIAQGL